MRNFLLTLMVLIIGCGTAISLQDKLPPKPPEQPPVLVEFVPGPVPHLLLEDSIKEETVSGLIKSLAIISAQSNVMAVVLEINSPGGDVEWGFRLAKAIERTPQPVICVVDGMAASMAFYILQSCTTRVMTERSVLMAHEPWSAAIVMGQEKDWEKVATNTVATLKALGRAICRHMARRMNISYDGFLAMVADGREWWMDMTEASKYGAVDEVFVSVDRVVEVLGGGH